MNKAIMFIKDVRTELSRVTWPSRDELLHSTSIVIVTTIMLSVFVGLVNFIISRALGWVLVGVR